VPGGDSDLSHATFGEEGVDYEDDHPADLNERRAHAANELQRFHEFPYQLSTIGITRSTDRYWQHDRP
jgi:hypothetical protein